MNTTETAQRPSRGSVFPPLLALASGLVLLGLVLAGALGLRLWAPAAPPEAGLSARPVLVYDATGAMLAALGPGSASVQPLPVYDATGAMLEARGAPADYRPLPVYDATGAMWLAVPVLRP